MTMLSAQEVIERLCKLQEEVWNQISSGMDAADCFCGQGGFWEGKNLSRYDGTYEKGYRNAGEPLEFIEKAVREKLAAMRAQR